jgi:hypothetical protein
MVQKLYNAVIIDCDVTKVITWLDFFKRIGSSQFTLKRFPL